MRQLFFRRWILDWGWPAVIVLVGGGCQNGCWWRDDCADIPHGAVPAPVGTYNGQWQHAQQSRAAEDYLVFYQYEWLGDSDQLSPFGERHVARLLSQLPLAATPLVVETSGDDRRDRSRVSALQIQLMQHDAAWADYPVVVGHSQAEPLYGVESRRVSSGFIGGGQAGGGQGGRFGGAGGGFGGAGGGFGGAGGGGGGFGGGFQ